MKYPEKEVNEILKRVYADFPTVRRYLIEYECFCLSPRKGGIRKLYKNFFQLFYAKL